jgi:hypothetical protein
VRGVLGGQEPADVGEPPSGVPAGGEDSGGIHRDSDVDQAGAGRTLQHPLDRRGASGGVFDPDAPAVVPCLEAVAADLFAPTQLE